MSFWNIFTSSNKNVETVTDGIVDGIDKIFYMDEEKAEHSLERQKANNKALELFTAYQTATMPQNVARRQIAIIVTTIWALFVIVAGVGVIFDFDYSGRLANFVNDNVNPPFMLVMAFYFLKRMKESFGK